MTGLFFGQCATESESEILHHELYHIGDRFLWSDPVNEFSNTVIKETTLCLPHDLELLRRDRGTFRNPLLEPEFFAYSHQDAAFQHINVVAVDRFTGKAGEQVNANPLLVKYNRRIITVEIDQPILQRPLPFPQTRFPAQTPVAEEHSLVNRVDQVLF